MKQPRRGLPLGDPAAWLVLALSGVFVALGLLFIASPWLGAALFGIPAPEGIPILYLPAIGLRDIAFGLYLAALTFLASPAALAAVLGLTVVIPLGDLLLIFVVRGVSSPAHLLLHGLSAAVLVVACALVLRLSRQRHGKDLP